MQTVRPQLILVDAGLPDLSGPELLRELQTRLPEVPVILLVDSHDRLDIAACLELGAEDIFIKPLRSGDLYRRLRRYLLPETSPEASLLPLAFQAPLYELPRRQAEVPGPESFQPLPERTLWLQTRGYQLSG